ncbi:hypothetical protein HPB50_006041 [Hyalomma asiaticum]|uniref:Uncharacterized protein n=1 Tax=Hyalomma asiaticum TaxID=266040 RepID=A0ACB7RJD5_HYAAI|nr:hypothetical protein HPB50_006041 [Hyalomma asiaticum]
MSRMNCCVVNCANSYEKCPPGTKFFRFPGGQCLVDQRERRSLIFREIILKGPRPPLRGPHGSPVLRKGTWTWSVITPYDFTVIAGRACEGLRRASQVERDIHKAPKFEIRSSFKIAGAPLCMATRHLTVSRHQVTIDVVDLFRSSTARRRRRQSAAQGRKPSQSSRTPLVYLGRVHDNVIIDLHLQEATHRKRVATAIPGNVNHSYEMGIHVARRVVDVNTIEFLRISVRKARQRRETCGKCSLRRLSECPASIPDKWLPLCHPRPAIATPSMGGRRPRRPLLPTPHMTPRRERRLSTPIALVHGCGHEASLRQRRVGLQTTPVHVTPRVRGAGAVFKRRKPRGHHTEPAGILGLDASRVPAGLQHLRLPLRHSEGPILPSRRSCTFGVIAVVDVDVLWRGGAEDVTLRKGSGSRFPVLPSAKGMGVELLQQQTGCLPVEWQEGQVVHVDASVALHSCAC